MLTKACVNAHVASAVLLPAVFTFLLLLLLLLLLFVSVLQY